MVLSEFFRYITMTAEKEDEKKISIDTHSDLSKKIPVATLKRLCH